jgi:phosphatidate cytidylyltransferase
LSDFGQRLVSGVLLAAVVLVDLWLGSWWYLALLAVGGIIVFWEFARLSFAITRKSLARLVWLVFGSVYITLAIYSLWRVRAMPDNGLFLAAWLFLIVWATDIGGYVFGRSIGGPKIAPSISPSKTWAGLLGGCVFVAIVMIAMLGIAGGYRSDVFPPWTLAATAALFGIPLVILAQAGDFFESWMKRRAGVKDSGTLIPGHGGLFDRVDGLLPVAIVFLPWMEMTR